MSRKICFKSFGVIGIKRKYNLCLLKFIKSKLALSTNSLIKANVVNVKYFLMICKYTFSNLCFYHIFLSFETQKKNRFLVLTVSHVSLYSFIFFQHNFPNTDSKKELININTEVPYHIKCNTRTHMVRYILTCSVFSIWGICLKQLFLLHDCYWCNVIILYYWHKMYVCFTMQLFY